MVPAMAYEVFGVREEDTSSSLHVPVRFGVKFDRNQLMDSDISTKCRKRSQRKSLEKYFNLIFSHKNNVVFFSYFHWHDLGFFAEILNFLGFFGKINCQDLGKKSQKFKLLARNSRLSKII